MPLKGAEQFIFSDPSLMKLIYNLVRRHMQTWGTGAAPFPPAAFPGMKTSNPNPNQDVYLRPKTQKAL